LAFLRFLALNFWRKPGAPAISCRWYVGSLRAQGAAFAVVCGIALSGSRRRAKSRGATYCSSSLPSPSTWMSRPRSG